MKIRDSVFVVTGGASGLGEATARMAVKHGAKAVLVDLNPGGAEIAGSLGDAAAFIQADITQETDATNAMQLALKRFGGVNVLVNCAGIAPSERIVGRTGVHQLDTFARTITVNLIGTFNMLRLAANAMSMNAPNVDEERGVIINTSSIAASEGQIGQIAYAASKGGVAAMTLPAARELARSGIRVVAIAPGLFMTPMMASFSEEIQASLAQSVPFPPRLGKPEEYARMVAAICENVMVNGETIRLDGALRMAAK